MKRELMHFQGVRVEDQRYPPVQDATFSLYEGEAILLTGLFQSGLTTLARLLAGEIGSFAGSIRLGGTPCRRITHETAAAQGLAVIGLQSRLSESLSYVENFQLIQGGGRRFGPLERVELTPAGRELFRLMELDPEKTRWTPFEQIKWNVMAAFFAGARIMLFTDITAACGGNDLAELESILFFLKEHGVSLLLVAFNDDLWCYTDVADRCLVMRKGVLSSTLHKGANGRFDMERLHHLVVGRQFPPRLLPPQPDPALAPPDGQFAIRLEPAGEVLPLPPGRITGLYDEATQLPAALDAFLAAQGRQYTLLRGGRPLAGHTPKDLALQQTAVIANGGAEQLIFRNLSPVENTALFAQRRMGRAALYKIHLARYLFDSVVARYEILKRCAALRDRADCFDLSYQSLFELMLAKWLAANPALVIFFTPLSNEDIKMTERFRDLRRQLKAAGKAVLLISNDYDYLDGSCDEIYSC